MTILLLYISVVNLREINLVYRSMTIFRVFRHFLIGSILLMGPASLVAQGMPPPMGGMDGQSINVKKFSADRELTRLSKRYKLTTEQKTKIRPILAEQEKQVHLLGEDESLSDTEWVVSVRKVHSKTVVQVKALMSDAQASKYIQDEEKRAKDDAEEDRMQEDGPPGGGGPPPGGGGGPPPGE
jgi:Spy/CpxP family protein refolding chaperone